MKLKDKVDSLIVVPNVRIFTVISKETPVVKAFEAIDDILRKALKGVVEIIAMPGIINVDFADVKNIMQDSGATIIGVGMAAGQDRAVSAVNQALHSPLLEATPEGAKAVLLGISGGKDLKMTEINEAAKIVAQTADPGARIIFGAYHDKNLKQGQIKVTVIAAGFNGSQPAALFGAGHYDRQGSMFGGGTRASASVGPGGSGDFASKRAQMPGKDTPPRERDQRDREREERTREGDMFSTNDIPASKASHGTPEAKSSMGTASKEAMRERDHKKEPESDAWDIPAFLRRRKK